MTQDRALKWIKFKYNNNDITLGTFRNLKSEINAGEMVLKNTELRLAELFSIDDIGTFVNSCLEVREEFNEKSEKNP